MTEKRRDDGLNISVSNIIFGEAKRIEGEEIFEVPVSVFISSGKDKPAVGVQGQFLIEGQPWGNPQQAIEGRISEKLILSGTKPNIALCVSRGNKKRDFSLQNFSLPKIKKADKKIRIDIEKSFDNNKNVLVMVRKSDHEGNPAKGKIICLYDTDKILSTVNQKPESYGSLKFSELKGVKTVSVDKKGLAFLFFTKKQEKTKAFLLAPENPERRTRVDIKGIPKKNDKPQTDPEKDPNKNDDKKRGPLLERMKDAFYEKSGLDKKDENERGVAP